VARDPTHAGTRAQDRVRSQWRDPTGEFSGRDPLAKGDFMNPVQAPQSLPPALRFSTHQFAARERVTAWREFVGRTFCRAEIEPLVQDGFFGGNVMRQLPGLGVISGNCSPLQYVQTRQLADSDDVILTLASGPWQLAHGGRTEAYAPGDAVLTSMAGVGSYTMYAGGPHWGLRVPLALLSPYVANIEDSFGRRIPAQSPAMRLLRRHLQLVEELDPPDMVEVRRLAAAHMRDLIAMAVGATRDGAEIARANGVRAARLHAIKADIRQNLASDLSVAALAARHRMPVRTLQRMFEADGVTFTDFLLAERLAHAHRMLRDAAHAGRPVSTIAFDCGFQHISYFNRVFRARFAASPTDVRVQARNSQANPAFGGTA
jgi:AraC-like DNA-binding protein